jgi:NADH-quinone oxidoreductase subunit N
MSGIDLMGLAPLLTLTAGAVLLMLQIAIRRAPTLSRSLSLAIYIVTLFVSVQAADMPARQITPLLLADSLALLFCAAFAIAAALTVMLSTNGLVAQSDQPDEFFLLLVLATLGACVLVYANHVASLLLGLELLSISLYALVAYPTRQQLPVEAAIKYLVLSGAATAILLFGFALLYAGTGALAFSAIGAGLGSAALGSSTLVFGAAMVLVGVWASSLRPRLCTCGPPMCIRARRGRYRVFWPRWQKPRLLSCCCVCLTRLICTASPRLSRRRRHWPYSAC